MPHVELSLTEGARLPDRPIRPDQPEPIPADAGGRRRPSPVRTGADPRASKTAAPAAGGRTAAGGSLQRWAAVVAAAPEPSLVLDASGVIVAASTACAELIGLEDLSAARGRRLRDAVVDLVDFTESVDKLDSAEADKIPPLLAISSGRLARGLMRVACPDNQSVSTMDAIATPLWGDATVTGSLTFFARI
ncbi:MAG: hypothetical protein GEV12_13525 [Micromonosporaceae bacterium]|nr:hypothetical protein [Micromonosporaceae bacterium]